MSQQNNNDNKALIFNELDIKIYDLKEVESILKVSNKTLLNYIKSGKIKATKIGGKWTITKENLERYVKGE